LTGEAQVPVIEHCLVIEPENPGEQDKVAVDPALVLIHDPSAEQTICWQLLTGEAQDPVIEHCLVIEPENPAEQDKVAVDPALVLIHDPSAEQTIC